MKFSILDASQQALIDNDLDVIDAVILTWFSDFIASGKMKHLEINGKIFHWLFYQNLIDELPVLKIKDRHFVQKRFNKYVEKGIVEKHIELNKGTYTFFRLTEKWYDELKSSGGVNPKIQGGCSEGFRGGESESSDKDSPQYYSPQEDSPQNNKEDDSKNQSSSKDELNLNQDKIPARRTKPREPIPPTLERVKQLAVENSIKMDCEAFFDHFESNGWLVGGRSKMVSVLAAMRNWARNEIKFSQNNNKSFKELERERRIKEADESAKRWGKALGRNQ